MVDFSAWSGCWPLADILKVGKREKKVGKIRKYSEGVFIRILTVRQFGLGLATVRVYEVWRADSAVFGNMARELKARRSLIGYLIHAIHGNYCQEPIQNISFETYSISALILYSRFKYCFQALFVREQQQELTDHGLHNCVAPPYFA